MQQATQLSSLILVVSLLLLTSGCKPKMVTPMSPDEIRAATEGQPQIFVQTKDGLTLEGLEKLYLGQSEEEGLSALGEYCDLIEVLEGGWRHRGAVFKGCIIDEGEEPRTIRAGFWPQSGNRVSTLEIKREVHHSMPLVRARFMEAVPDLTEDLPRAGVLVMSTPRYRLFTNWDEGKDGATHITMGFTTDYARTLAP